MYFSNEWTDWHLTPQGWVKGSYKTDFNDVINVPCPMDRLLTRRYIEQIETLKSPLRIFRRNIWACADMVEIKRFCKIYEYPNSLNKRVEVLVSPELKVCC